MRPIFSLLAAVEVAPRAIQWLARGFRHPWAMYGGRRRRCLRRNGCDGANLLGGQAHERRGPYMGRWFLAMQLLMWWRTMRGS